MAVLEAHARNADVCSTAVSALSRIAECASLTDPAQRPHLLEQQRLRVGAVRPAYGILISVHIAHAGNEKLQKAVLNLLATLLGGKVTAQDRVEEEKQRRKAALDAAAAAAGREALD